MLKLAAAVLVLTPTIAQAQPCDERFVLHNNSSRSIAEFYASNSGSDEFGENMLQGEVLPPNHYITVDPYDGTAASIYDLEAVLEDGVKVYKFRVNVCNMRDYTVYDK